MEKSGTPAVVVDVRDEDEFSSTGTLPIMESSQMKVALGDLREALPKLVSSGEISADKPVIFTCKTGARAHVGACMARHMGLPQAKVLAGSFLTAQICKKMG